MTAFLRKPGFAAQALLAAVVLSPFAARAQSQTATLSPLAASFTEVLHRAETGHSPAPEDLAAAADPSQPIPDAASIAQAMPLILKAVDHTDPQVRSYALIRLQGFRAGESNPVFKAPVARALTPAIPTIAKHLTDENTENRVLTTVILGGFAPNPPAEVYPPLIAFLKRDDAISPIGEAVVIDLLGLGPIPADAATAVVRYLHRPDQTPDSRSNLVDSIASQPNQSAQVNAAVIAWMDADDPSLRARVILSLPQLDMPAELFADTRARINALSTNDSENLQVVTAARAVAPCWTQVRMTTPCPVYDTGDKPAAPPK